MSLKLYLLGIGLTSIAALAVWLGVIFSIDPAQAGTFEFILFYGSLLIFLMGSISLLVFYIRLFRSNNEFYYGNLLMSLRQGFLFSFWLCASLVLKGLRIIGFTEIALLLAATLLFELYFSAKK